MSTDSKYEPTQPAAIGPRNVTAAIFLVSVLGLYLELLLIRWIGTEVRIFAYLQNTVLVVCFLGLGMGCLTCRGRIDFRRTLVPLLILTALLSYPKAKLFLETISKKLSVLDDFVIWDQGRALGNWEVVSELAIGLGLSFGLMMLIWDVFVPIGRLLGRLLDDHPKTIWAYSVNVAGSLVGTWLFVLLSVLEQPPWVWLVVFSGLMFFFISKSNGERIQSLAMLAAIVLMAGLAGIRTGGATVRWSPYQKLVLLESEPDASYKYRILVNNCGYQAIYDLRPDVLEMAKPGRHRRDMIGRGQYDLPCLLHPDPQNVLIVGAGSGNDAAGALRNGAGQVVAVEIDPVIFAMGKQYHPEKPYSAPNITLVTDDARSYFATSTEKFDVISFGLLDSHTTTAMTNARLDHYVYTKESIEQTKRLLKQGGIVTLSFSASRPYIADRMARVLRDVFGAEPLCFRVPQNSLGLEGIVFVTGDLATARARIAGDAPLAALIDEWTRDQPFELSYSTPVATDDWPYIYLDRPRIPLLYFLLAGLLGLLFLGGQWRMKTSVWMKEWTGVHWHFFFLGAAFMLLEVQNISKAAVVLGNTWWVNAVIISAVLVMVLFANSLAATWRHLPLAPVYLCLVGSCVALYFVDISRFAFLPFATKAVVVGLLTTLPMLFSGIVFVRSFAGVLRKDYALGANLFGAMAGAILQSLTFLTGIAALLLVVAGLYGLAYLTRPRLDRSRPPLPVVRRTEAIAADRALV